MQYEPDSLESLLLRYRPAGPSPELREDVLAAINGGSLPATTSYRWPLAAAAVWLLCCGLWFACMQLNAGTARMLAIEPILSESDRATIALLGGGKHAEQYVRIALSTHGPLPAATGSGLREINGDLR